MKVKIEKVDINSVKDHFTLRTPHFYFHKNLLSCWLEFNCFNFRIVFNWRTSWGRAWEKRLKEKTK